MAISVEEFLQAEGSSAEGIAARFAYQMGLLPTEMVSLTWTDFDLDRAFLSVGLRQIPIPEDFLSLLKGRKSAYGNFTTEHLVFFLDSGSSVYRQQVSRWVRLALNKYGLYDVTLASLRNTFICDTLSSHGWEYTSQITGLKYASLNDIIKKYGIPTDIKSDNIVLPSIEEAEQIVLAHKDPPAGTILRLAFYLDMSQRQMATLKWGDVDLETGRIATKSTIMPASLVSYLSELKSQNSLLSEYVIIGCRDHKALPSDYISRIGKQILVDAGYKDLTLKMLYCWALMESRDKRLIVDYIKSHGPSTKKVIASELDIPEKTCDSLFSSLTKENVLKAGSDFNGTYYVSEQKTPFEYQAEVVLQYVNDNGSITASQVAELLSFQNREQYYLLKRMEKEGLIKKSGNHYFPK